MDAGDLRVLQKLGLTEEDTPLVDDILRELQISRQELTKVIRARPSLRGIIIGYVAEDRLMKLWFENKPNVETIHTKDDHDRSGKGDRILTYKRQEIRIEVKSLQSTMIKKTKDGYDGKTQVDASDRRTVTLPNGRRIETTCLLIGEFDLLAVNLFEFEKKWRFIFAKNKDLPRSTFRKYSPAVQKHLLATLVPVSWPPKAPFREEPFSLMDEIIAERTKSR